MKFRKKPVVIEAVQIPPSMVITLRNAQDFERDNNLPQWAVGGMNGKTGIIIPTLEGNYLAEQGDWIIKGIHGEFYPCKPDIFQLTYESAESHPAPTPDLLLTDEAKEMITKQLPKFEQDVRESERKAIWKVLNQFIYEREDGNHHLHAYDVQDFIASLKAGEPPQENQ